MVPVGRAQRPWVGELIRPQVVRHVRHDRGNDRLDLRVGERVARVLGDRDRPQGCRPSTTSHTTPSCDGRTRTTMVGNLVRRSRPSLEASDSNATDAASTGRFSPIRPHPRVGPNLVSTVGPIGLDTLNCPGELGGGDQDGLIEPLGVEADGAHEVAPTGGWRIGPARRRRRASLVGQTAGDTAQGQADRFLRSRSPGVEPLVLGAREPVWQVQARSRPSPRLGDAERGVVESPCLPCRW